MRAGQRAGLLLGCAAGIATAGFLSDFRLARDLPPSDAWRHTPVAPRGSTRLGISFRPIQAETMGLEPADALAALLAFPFELVRLGAYWSQIEPRAGSWEIGDLDHQVDAAQKAGKQIILGVGPIKNFGYPEFFIPTHQLTTPLPEGCIIDRVAHMSLFEAAIEFITRIVDRFRDCEAIVAWQVEHEAVDPLGFEHSWRLSAEFVEREVEAVRRLDPGRPILLNGFLPTSLAVATSQWWRTRDQGDSLALALRLADIVGVDFYPRHAVAEVGRRTLYLDGGQAPWQAWHRRRLFASKRLRGRRLIVAEGQSEPWETVTTPPATPQLHSYSCPPERIITNFNDCIEWAADAAATLDAYLFWGAEYWLLRDRAGDGAYLSAFTRVMSSA